LRCHATSREEKSDVSEEADAAGAADVDERSAERGVKREGIEI